MSIEADKDGQTIIFPLGPALQVSWATCDMGTNADRMNAALWSSILFLGAVAPPTSFAQAVSADITRAQLPDYSELDYVRVYGMSQ